jgi:protein O-GlcNAc transferase
MSWLMRENGGAPAADASPADVWHLPFDYDLARAAGFQGTEAEAYETLGERLRSLGQTDDALLAFHRAAELDPTNSLVWYRIGHLHLNEKRYDQAAEALATSTTLLPDHWVTQHSLGKALAGLDRHPQATAAFTRAAELNPKSAAPLVQRARCNEAMGRLDDAIADVEAALKLQPGGKRHWQMLESLRQRKHNHTR